MYDFTRWEIAGFLVVHGVLSVVVSLVVCFLGFVLWKRRK